jgi:hypothetical protein
MSRARRQFSTLKDYKDSILVGFVDGSEREEQLSARHRVPCLDANRITRQVTRDLSYLLGFVSPLH